MNAFIKFGQILSVCCQDIEWKQSSGINQGPYLFYKYVKKDVIDLVNRNVYIKFGENLSICSQDIEWKRNSGINQEP